MDDGFAVGCAIVVELNPVDGLQLYVLPTIDVVPIVAVGVVHVVVCALPASAVGVALFTVTVTEDVAVHPLLPVTVTV